MQTFRNCPKCGKKMQYYRKRTNDWRCNSCGTVNANGEETEQKENKGLFDSVKNVFKKVMGVN